MVLGQHLNTRIGDGIMSTDKKKMTAKEKTEKAKKLMSELKSLELSKDQLDRLAGGESFRVANNHSTRSAPEGYRCF